MDKMIDAYGLRGMSIYVIALSRAKSDAKTQPCRRSHHRCRGPGSAEHEQIPAASSGKLDGACLLIVAGAFQIVQLIDDSRLYDLLWSSGGFD